MDQLVAGDEPSVLDELGLRRKHVCGRQIQVVVRRIVFRQGNHSDGHFWNGGTSMSPITDDKS